jgi:hypothetical protein
MFSIMSDELYFLNTHKRVPIFVSTGLHGVPNKIQHLLTPQFDPFCSCDFARRCPSFHS